MTSLGKYLIGKAISKAEVSRKTGILKSRLSNLCLKEGTNLKAEELYLIAKSIDVDPKEILNKMYSELELKR